MLDPAATGGTVGPKSCPVDALLPCVGGRDRALIDLVVEIVVRPDIAGIHVAEHEADLFVGRDLLPDGQRRMGSIDTALQVPQICQQALDPVGADARVALLAGVMLGAARAAEPVACRFFRLYGCRHSGVPSFLALAPVPLP